ncbi:BlaR1 peptidase M56 [Granulicella rosea]|uniref:BlaR1 peptidase M56 n=1 Tax=Granulicella rosea TaxID=474952 RepID=A0A239KMA2_9BACT|nr:M56 family metallopeptidase [Granulicella rosea]SNT19486.1 BlaR1 peptidase M56 [Granulicella rosea]
MNTGSLILSGWLSRAELVALGWTLLHFCWQGTAVAVAYTLLDRMTSRAAAPVRYATALLALAMMPVAAALTFTDQLHMARLQTANPARTVTLPATYTPSVDSEASQTPQQAFQAVADLALETTFEAHQELAARAERAMPYIDALWLVGMLLLTLRSLGGWWQLHQMRRRARGLVPLAVQAAFDRVRVRLRAGRRVALRISDEVISPLAMGVWRATVILPVSAVVRLPMEELEAVLAHELGHIQRWDYLCNLAQTAIESVLFFHPSVWWLSRIVRERRELCCDAIAARSCADPVVYARALLQLEEHRAERRIDLPLAMAIDGCGTSLLSRIKQVLGEDAPMESRMTSGVRVAAAAGVVMALLLSSKVSTALAAPVAEPAPQVSAVQVALPAPQVPAPLAPEPAAPAVPAPPVPGEVSIAPAAPESAGSFSTTFSSTSHSESGKSSSTTSTTMTKTVNDSEVAAALDAAMPALAAYKADGGAQFARLQPMLMQMDARMKADPAMPKGMAYLDQMRDAGYAFDLNSDLDKIIELKALGVTPAFAKGMASLGLGKPSVRELTSLKALGVTPEYAQQLKQSGLTPKDFRELSNDRALGITPEYVAGMRQKGFTGLSGHDLMTLKAQGMTPEYAGWLKQQFPQAGMDELSRAVVFHFDDKFVAAAKAHGYDTNDLNKMLKLKLSGLLDE